MLIRRLPLLSRVLMSVTDQKTISLPARPNPKRILIFDVDGTLTVPRNRITPDMAEFLKEARKYSYIGTIGGSDLAKQQEQLGDDLLQEWDYVFAENGLVAHKGGKLIAVQSLKDYLGEDKLKKIINFILHYIADLDIPIKRGTFIEFRNGMLNVSPIGRNCSQSERDAFEVYDKEHKVRDKMVAALKAEFADYDLTYSIGGQISMDIFPRGWDKTFCLQFLKADGFEEIHFFGDKCHPGGNDYEIYESPETIGHKVVTYDDTRRGVEELLKM